MEEEMKTSMPPTTLRDAPILVLGDDPDDNRKIVDTLAKNGFSNVAQRSFAGFEAEPGILGHFRAVIADLRCPAGCHIEVDEDDQGVRIASTLANDGSFMGEKLTLLQHHLTAHRQETIGIGLSDLSSVAYLAGEAGLKAGIWTGDSQAMAALPQTVLSLLAAPGAQVNDADSHERWLVKNRQYMAH